MGKQNVALVAGCTGLVGNALIELLVRPDTAGGPWKVYGTARRARPNWLSPEVMYIQSDFLNREDTLAKLSPLTDVTHLFWATWTTNVAASEADNRVDNVKMFRNVLDEVVRNAKDLEHIILTTGGGHYVGSFAARMNGSIEHYETPYTEDMPRHAVPHYYYHWEDMVFETVQQKEGKLTWSVHRPGIIFGVAPENFYNMLGTLAVYGSICKHVGLPFVFPGTQQAWEAVREASNSDLIAEQEVWAATDPKGKNQAFNIINGDVYKWKTLWKLLAEGLGLDYVPFSGQPTPLVQYMKGMGPVWDQIVQENGLYPSKLNDVAGWVGADLVFDLKFWGDDMLSMNKSKEHGFFGFRNTESSVLSFIDKMKERKFIP